jgi:hypothetical protein
MGHHSTHLHVQMSEHTVVSLGTAQEAHQHDDQLRKLGRQRRTSEITIMKGLVRAYDELRHTDVS